MAEERELAVVRGRLLGLVGEERIARVAVARPDAAVVAGFLELGDLCSTVSDALDGLGAGVGIGSSELRPLAARRLCGPAITIRYGAEGGSVGALAAQGERGHASRSATSMASASWATSPSSTAAASPARP